MDPETARTLRNAIQAYDFPAVTYDFNRGFENSHTTMRGVERTIRDQLTSEDPIDVGHGLSNVLYWGYARMGIRDVRVGRFRDAVTDTQLYAARDLFQNPNRVNVVSIKMLALPEFSQLSFVSKVRMFLDPEHFVTLDRKLAKMQSEPAATVLHGLKLYPTSIPVTDHNAAVYERWCQLCRTAAQELGDGARAVDVERGIFHIVDVQGATRAAVILNRLDPPKVSTESGDRRILAKPRIGESDRVVGEPKSKHVRDKPELVEHYLRLEPETQFIFDYVRTSVLKGCPEAGYGYRKDDRFYFDVAGTNVCCLHLQQRGLKLSLKIQGYPRPIAYVLEPSSERSDWIDYHVYDRDHADEAVQIAVEFLRYRLAMEVDQEHGSLEAKSRAD